MVPPAPVTFSTRIVWPSDCFIGSAKIRARVSVGPPAANGTMSVIGLAGKLCAAIELASDSNPQASALLRNRIGSSSIRRLPYAVWGDPVNDARCRAATLRNACQASNHSTLLHCGDICARIRPLHSTAHPFQFCLLYTSDAADERSSVDLGGRRII